LAEQSADVRRAMNLPHGAAALVNSINIKVVGQFEGTLFQGLKPSFILLAFGPAKAVPLLQSRSLFRHD
jgi:hypothetical protein